MDSDTPFKMTTLTTVSVMGCGQDKQKQGYPLAGNHNNPVGNGGGLDQSEAMEIDGK